MNHPAKALFDTLHGGLNGTTKTLASELETLAWYFLGRFDNVGCSLPPGILGYNIVAKPSAEREGGQIIALQEVDIREGEQDYSDMWFDYLAGKSPGSTKAGESSVDG